MKKSKKKLQSKENKGFSLLCQKAKQVCLRGLKAAGIAVAGMIVLILGINGYMIFRTGSKILDSEELQAEAANGKFDYIIVLGAGVRPNGEPSRILKERIDKGAEAYHLLGSPLLMSGDSVDRYYKETVVMAAKAIDQGVPEEALLEDKYGISTYDSVWRLKQIYRGKKVLIVTQGYHLSRSIYLAEELGMEAYGFDARKTRYTGQLYRDIREIMARAKDFALGFLQPPAHYTESGK